MKKRVQSIIFLLVVSFFVVSCSKDDDPAPTPISKDVYACGYERVAGTYVAKYWKNGTAVTLTDGTRNAIAFDIFVSGNDVYVCGYEFNAIGLPVAKYWKNGVATNLTDGSFSAMAKSIYVDGNEVNIAGYQLNAGGIARGTVWNSDGTSLTVSTGVLRGFAEDIIAFTNGAWYVAGFLENASGKNEATSWTNGISTSHSNPTKNGYAYGIAKNGSDLYVAGYEANSAGKFVAKYWTNSGAAINLTDGSYDGYARKIAVSGTDVHTVGMEYNAAGKQVARYWKNTSPITITDGTKDSEANDIAINSNDVYIVGFEIVDGLEKAIIWKNGTATIIGSGTNSAILYGVFVK